MYFLLLLSIIFASLNSVVLHKAELKGQSSVYLYNFIASAVWCVALLLANGFKLRLTGGVILFGAIYGTVQALFILFKTLAMNKGPVAVTTLVGNFSLVVSVFVCFLIFDEAISLADLLGLALLMCGIVFTTYKKSGTSGSRLWRVYVILFFICAAGVGITFKAFSRSASAEYAGDMMLTSAIVMLVLYGVILLFSKPASAVASMRSDRRICRFTIYALVSGALSCLYNRLNIYLSGALRGVIFFPSFNGGVVVLSTVLSIILLRERIKAKQAAGIILGILGILIIGIF